MQTLQHSEKAYGLHHLDHGCTLNQMLKQNLVVRLWVVLSSILLATIAHFESHVLGSITESCKLANFKLPESVASECFHSLGRYPQVGVTLEASF